MTKQKVKTGFLFAMPSFLSGVAQSFDLFGDFISYNESASPEQADAEALYNDWKMVGSDIQSAIAAIEHETHVV